MPSLLNCAPFALAEPAVIFQLGGWTRATRFHAFEPALAAVKFLPLKPPGKFDEPAGMVAREVRVKSHDGVEVPMSIIARFSR